MHVVMFGDQHVESLGGAQVSMRLQRRFLERAGHTEASIDLARLAGRSPAAVICEIAGPDGEMMRLPELLAFGAQHGLPVVAISDLAIHLGDPKERVRRVSSADIPLDAGEFEVHYQPIVDLEGERTVGQWTAEEKNAESHRSRAFVQLSPLLASL